MFEDGCTMFLILVRNEALVCPSVQVYVCTALCKYVFYCVHIRAHVLVCDGAGVRPGCTISHVQAFPFRWALIYVQCDHVCRLWNSGFTVCCCCHPSTFACTRTEGSLHQSITFLFHRFKAPVKWGLYQFPLAYPCGLALSTDLLVEEMALSCVAVLKVA